MATTLDKAQIKRHAENAITRIASANHHLTTLIAKLDGDADLTETEIEVIAECARDALHAATARATGVLLNCPRWATAHCK